MIFGFVIASRFLNDLLVRADRASLPMKNFEENTTDYMLIQLILSNLSILIVLFIFFP